MKGCKAPSRPSLSAPGGRGRTYITRVRRPAGAHTRRWSPPWSSRIFAQPDAESTWAQHTRLSEHLHQRFPAVAVVRRGFNLDPLVLVDEPIADRAQPPVPSTLWVAATRFGRDLALRRVVLRKNGPGRGFPFAARQ